MWLDGMLSGKVGGTLPPWNLAPLLAGAWLVWFGGWPILAVGLASIIAGVGYTGGPRPIAYTATGELFVFVFFGLVAVLGSYYVQNLALTWAGVLSASIIGSLGAAVIVVNNYRDLDNDRAVGKRTLAVRIGRTWSRVEFVALVGLPYVLLLPLERFVHAGWWLLLPACSLPMAAWITARFLRERPGSGFNRILADTAQLQLIFSGLLAVALLP